MFIEFCIRFYPNNNYYCIVLSLSGGKNILTGTCGAFCNPGLLFLARIQRESTLRIAMLNRLRQAQPDFKAPLGVWGKCLRYFILFQRLPYYFMDKLHSCFEWWQELHGPARRRLLLTGPPFVPKALFSNLQSLILVRNSKAPFRGFGPDMI